MMQTPHVNQRHASCNRQLWIGEIAPQYLVPHVRAETNGKLKEITRKDTQPSKLDYPKVQKNDLCSVPKTLFAQAIKQQNSQEIPTGFQQFMPSTPRDKHLPQEELRFYKHYLKKRMQDTQYAASGLELFKEIQAKGYRGSLGSLKNFLSTIRRNQRLSETRLAFHRDYLIKRMEETEYRVSGSQLFKEIEIKGYRGAASTVKSFLSAIRQDKRPPERCLPFHQDYLEKKIERESQTRRTPTLQLFKEIQDRGYRGSIGRLEKKLAIMRKETAIKKTQSAGYLGSIKTVQNFLMTTQSSKRSPEACLGFHRDALIKKIKGMPSHHITGAGLFKDIRSKGYRGSLRTVQRFAATIRKNNHLPEECA